MTCNRIFTSSRFMQPADGEPVRSVITQSAEAAVVGWYVKPGQRIAAHVHPQGQDTWTVLSGRGQYQLDADGASRTIVPGDVVIAHTGAVHGVYNDGDQPLIFISVVSPAEAGYELLSDR
jgi:quercetin dioxygenase-like cupin family protein